MDEFTVVEGRGKALLGKDTAEKLNVLRVGPPNSPQAYSITSEGTSVDIVKNFAHVFSGVGKLKIFQLKFLSDFFQVAEPLRTLARKDQQFMWEDAQQKSFQKLKDLLTRAETLAYFKNESRARIVADAGPTGIGAVLTQLQDGLWKVISYASRNLTDVERRYSQTEKEGLALVWACERFKLYVFGREFELETDHKPLQCI